MLQLRSSVEWQNLDGEVVVLDLHSSVYLLANVSAARLWPLVAHGTTEAGLVDELVGAYGLDDARARADVADFVARLRALSLLDDDA